MPPTTHSAAQYRKRAQEIREIAKGIFDDKERAKLLGIAREYVPVVRETEQK